MPNLQQNRKSALDKIPEIFVNCTQSSYLVTLVIYKKFLSTFLTIWFGKFQNNYTPKCRWTALDIYLDALRLGTCNHYLPLLREIVVFFGGRGGGRGHVEMNDKEIEWKENKLWTKVSLSSPTTTETFTNHLIIDFIVFVETTSLDS